MLFHIGIAGDFNPELRSHRATNDALRHAADALEITVSANWLPTESLAGPEGGGRLESQDAILAAPGSPYRSFDGMLAAIEFARRSGVPFLGTCGGFQYAVLEFARHVLGMPDANTAENRERPAELVVTPVACPVPDRAPGAPKLSGRRRLTFPRGSMLAGIYGTATADEEYFCNFEVNRKHVPALERGGMAVAALGPRGELRAVELPSHPFFLATLFQPQLSSEEGRPHPVLTAFLSAAVSQRGRTAANYMQT